MVFGVRLLVGGLGLWLASELVPGISVRDDWTLLGAAILLGIVNAIVRPVLVVLTLPITVLTLGLFLLVINAAIWASSPPCFRVSRLRASGRRCWARSSSASPAGWHPGSLGRVGEWR